MTRLVLCRSMAHPYLQLAEQQPGGKLQFRRENRKIGGLFCTIRKTGSKLAET
jgi:hypothetical protein